MKTFKNQAAQGDILVNRILNKDGSNGKLPNDVVEVKPVGGQFVIAHSETGHHHVIKAAPGVEYYTSANDNNIAYLVVSNGADGTITHLREHHTHEAIKPESDGVFEIRRQRESTPEGFRRVQD